MSTGLLESVLEATPTGREVRASKLDRFLNERGWAQALAIWLELDADHPVPSRTDIARLIALQIAAIDRLIGDQLDQVLHHTRFQRLEASWRGLHYLCGQTDGSDNVKIRVMGASLRELERDLERAIDFDQSELFGKVYSQEFDMPGGEPYGVLLGDYFLKLRPDADDPVDGVGLLREMSRVAAAAFAPFLTGVHPSFFGLDGFHELARPIDLERVFRAPEYTAWNGLRDTEDARFCGLVLPRVLMRRPWRHDPFRADGFRYKEDVSAPDRSSFLWGNAVYAFGSVLIRAFRDCGWLASIRGVERDVDGGGLVPDLLADDFATDAPGIAPRPATEVVLTDRREKELGDLGFIGLSACHGTPFAAFYSTPSIQRPRVYDDAEAQVNARLSAMLQYILCVSRFAHYVKVIVRDRVGSFTSAGELQRMLNDWLRNFETANEDIDSELQARYPLREARAEVRERPGTAGVYLSTLHLRPHFQLDRMTTSVKLTTQIDELQVN